jgi:outer membrane lipoprotein-sorting protein
VNRLRLLPTRKLVTLCVAIASLVVTAAAIAAAVGTSGPVPPPRPLAQAVHGALAAPPITGIDARVSFTNKLVDTSNLEGVSPLLAGATGRLWAAPDGKLRLELQSDRGDAQLVSDGRSFFLYDASSDTVYRGSLPADRRHEPARHEGVPSVARIQQGIARLGRFAGVTGPARGSLAGRPAYTVRLAPRHNHGLIGGLELAWDAARGAPLRLGVFATGNPSPVLELKATDVSYGPVPASTFAIAPPKSAHVVDLGTRGRAPRRGAKGHAAEGPNVNGAAAVSHALPFHLSAPASLVGRPRTRVHLISSDGGKGAAIAYGRPLLGGVLVLEQRAVPERAQNPNGLEAKLPHVDVNGASATELATALGTVVRFERAGVRYTVIGPVTPAVALAAARAL